MPAVVASYYGPPQLNRWPGSPDAQSLETVVQASSCLTFDVRVSSNGDISVVGDVPWNACSQNASSSSQQESQSAHNSVSESDIPYPRIVSTVSTDTKFPRTTFRICFAPSALTSKRGFRKISCGRAHIIALVEGGLVFCWGANEFGQVSPREASVLAAPCLVDLPCISGGSQLRCDVAAGNDHSLALCHGEAWSWGKGLHGQLGIGPPANQTQDQGEDQGATAADLFDAADTLRRVRPTKVALAGIKVTMVAAGSEHSMFLSEKGSLYSCGWSLYHQLGVENTANAFTPTQVTTFEVGQSKTSAVPIVRVSCGTWHSAAVDKMHRVYTWGWNKFLQLGPTLEESNQVTNGEHVPSSQASSGAGDSCSSNANDSTTIRQVPTAIALPWSTKENSEERIRVYCGSRHTLCVKDNGFCAFGTMMSVSGPPHQTVYDAGPHNTKSHPTMAGDAINQRIKAVCNGRWSFTILRQPSPPTGSKATESKQ